MKKILAAATALALAGLTAAAQDNYSTTLRTGAGDISFGAWGRSTFNIGHSEVDTKITADATALGQQALAGVTDAESAYTALGGSLTSSDEGYIADVISTVSAAQAAQAVATGTIDSSAQAAYQAEAAAVLTQAYQAKAAIAMLKAMETDESTSKNYASLDPDWSYGSRVGFWIIGRTPENHFGFDFNLDADGHALFVHKLYDSTESEDDVNYNEDGKYAVAIGDQAKIWAQGDIEPLAITGKIAFGKMRENYLRGSIGDFGQRESSDVKSEDDIFSEFWPTTGLFVSATGMADTVLEGAYAAASIDLSGTLGVSCADADRDGDMPLYDALRTAQAGIGYTIPGVVQLKAQYWGDSISADNYRYAESKFESARSAGYDMNDYYGRLEFGIDYLGFMGGANGLSDVDLEKTPNASLIELGFKLPLVTRDELREYDPETFYNWYSCLGTMGVIEKGFILYKGHIWGGQGTSNLAQYTPGGIVTLEKGKGADILMAGIDALAEICINPFGSQDLFVGISGNYNITKADGEDSTFSDLELRQHNAGAEIYVKKTFGANNYLFVGIADRYTKATMDGCVAGLCNLSYESSSNKIYMPIGIEMFF
ncbi:hypothetical protein [Treponema sp.]|uniref:hypothetical protein n=1 Tax=Treponema sp. TaxID=166 RepID=UPI0025E7AF84|nr:hypothetical protein [Treponema sp.]MCR5217266.1 hypothetical protein [Treponema sp.]